MAPVTGFHCVIDSPLSVSRVIPPTTTIANTRPATTSSKFEMARGRSRLGAWAAAEAATVLMRHAPIRVRRAAGQGAQNVRCYIVTKTTEGYMPPEYAPARCPDEPPGPDCHGHIRAVP